MPKTYSGIFVGEGSSDAPLADIVELLFLREGVLVTLSRPDFAALQVPKDVRSRVRAGLKLVGTDVDLIVVHRDADNAGVDLRESEIIRAVSALDTRAALVPVIPVRMTEAWLLLDEPAIRQVAGNPNGRAALTLPKADAVERVADPKTVLHDCILTAACVTGRRRDRLAKRFGQSRRQLLDRLDPDGPVSSLTSWRTLAAHVADVAARWASPAS